MSSSLDIDEQMNFEQRKQDEHLKDQRNKGASTSEGDFTNGADKFPLCSCTPPTASVMNIIKKPGPNQGKKFFQCRHWRNQDLACDFWTLG